MNEKLKTKFNTAQIEAVGALRESALSDDEKVLGLFEELSDSLLSASEVSEILGISQEVAAGSLRALADKSHLESSDSTVRPLDSEDATLYRRQDVPFTRLKILATESKLSDGSSRFHFACNGRLVRSIAKVDRLDAIAGTGNQREEVTKHIEKIAEGIKAGTQIPNSILLVIDEARVSDEADAPESFVKITPLDDEWIEIPSPTSAYSHAQRIRNVELDFPFREAAFDEEKPALLVDGQQRTAALALVDIEQVPDFVLSVNAVCADPEQAKRVFQVANTTVKISTQFSRALMAAMSEAPTYLRSEQTRAEAVKSLALEDKDSPFFGLVQHPGTQQTPKPVIAYNSMFNVVTAFANSALPIDSDPKMLAQTIKQSFKIVKDAWPVAWGKRPTHSRLMHGAGLRSVGQLLASKLTSLFEKHGDLQAPEVWSELEKSIARLKPIIIWSNDEIATANKTATDNYKDQIMTRQNTSQDIEKLSSWLQKESLSLDTKSAKERKATARQS